MYVIMFKKMSFNTLILHVLMGNFKFINISRERNFYIKLQSFNKVQEMRVDVKYGFSSSQKCFPWLKRIFKKKIIICTILCWNAIRWDNFAIHMVFCRCLQVAAKAWADMNPSSFPSFLPLLLRWTFFTTQVVYLSNNLKYFPLFFDLFLLIIWCGTFKNTFHI